MFWNGSIASNNYLVMFQWLEFNKSQLLKPLSNLGEEKSSDSILFIKISNQQRYSRSVSVGWFQSL